MSPQPPPLDLTDAESAEVAKHIAAAVDRICDGGRMVCFNMKNPDGSPRVDVHGRCLVYLVTTDPELWPAIVDIAKRFGEYTRSKEAATAADAAEARPVLSKPS